MGFDVFGIKPKNESGEYFRANVWMWPSILELVEKAGVLDEETLFSMSFNDGTEVSAEEAELLADRIEAMVGDVADDVAFIPMAVQNKVGMMLLNALNNIEGEHKVEPEVPVYSADGALVKEFITFARNSGGFNVF